ncbi:MAG: DUF779 domain-containing protein [Terriglobales bacterium]|jgi:hypothetical protein
MKDRIQITARAAALLREMEKRHGPLLFHQGGGCCDGSVPLCLKQSEFRVGSKDVLLGFVEGTPFYLGAGQPEQVAQQGVVLDVADGDTDRFSVEAAEGVYFVSRPRLRSSCRKEGPGLAGTEKINSENDER